MTGIGGDCFALVGLPDGTVHGLNGSGRSALAADADWLKRAKLKAIDPYFHPRGDRSRRHRCVGPNC